jgi:molecular chaperone DnaK
VTDREATIGIDLGTTNSVVAACDQGGEPRVLPDEHDERIHPSVVSFHPNGAVIVGSVAKQRRVIDPANTVYSIKRLIGRTYSAPEVQAAIERMPFAILEGPNQQPVIRTRGGQFAIPELSAIVLDHMRTLAKRALRHDTNRAVITVPANFNEGQRSATATAGAIAGLTVEQIINEPTAAALAYGHRRELDRMIAVYDFGGGTFDISILNLENNVYEVLATAGNSFLGGDDIDETLVDHMVDLFLRQQAVDLRGDDLAMQRLRSVAEQIKIQLSRRTRAIVKIDEIAYGPGGRGLDLNLEINREELVARCAHVVDRTFPVCDEALALAQIDRTRITDVVLVGGTTKMPYVRQRATHYFGTQPRVDVNPDEAVALGAALQADVIARRAAGQRVPSRSGTATDTEVTGFDPNVGQRVAKIIEQTEKRRQSAPSMSVIIDGEDPEFADESTDGSGIFLTLDESEVTDAEAIKARRLPTRDTLRGVGKTSPEGAGKARRSRTTAPPRTTQRGAPPIPRPLPGALPGPDDADADTDITATRDTATRPRAARNLPTSTEPPPPPPTGSATLDDFRSPAGLPPRPPPRQVRESQLQTTPRAPRPRPPPAASPPPPPLPEGPPVFASPGRAGPLERTMMPSAIPAEPISGVGLEDTSDFPTIENDPSQPLPELSPTPLPIGPTIREVTPHSLGIGTVGGFCEPLIARNTRLPAEVKKMFSTSKDGQQTVRIRVFQGESRRLADNQRLGDLVLDGLPPRSRGETTIEVTFSINASGMLEVFAVDTQTGYQQTASVELIGAQSPAEVAASQERMRQFLR